MVIGCCCVVVLLSPVPFSLTFVGTIVADIVHSS